MWTVGVSTRYPRFRRDPCARDVALDPGGTTMPRVTALLMLRSTMKTVSAPASRSFRGSLPTHPLCTLRVRRHRRLAGTASQEIAAGVFPCAAAWTSLATLEPFAIASQHSADARRHVDRAWHHAKGDLHTWRE